MIEGVLVKRLTVYNDDRGCLMEIMKAGDPLYREIRQTTYTEAHPGVIKAFHWHRRQYDLWFFSTGMAQVVLHDMRTDSPTAGSTDVFFMGEKNPILLLIPPGVAHGYRVLGTRPAGLFYHTTEAYDPEDPDEERLPYNAPEIGFDWATRPR